MPEMIFYPSVDGVARHTGTNEAWSTIRDGVGTHAFDDDTRFFATYLHKDGNLPTPGNDIWDNIYRGIFIFDTRELPDNCIITNAVFSLRSNEKQDTLSITPNLNVYESYAMNLPVKYDGNPVFSYGGTWDYDKYSPTVLYRAEWPAESRWRMWYQGMDTTEWPSTYQCWCYACSADGLT